MLLRARPLLALVTTLALVLCLASPAGATELTFKRAMTNLLFGPLDIALSPIVAPKSVYDNLQDIDDSELQTHLIGGYATYYVTEFLRFRTGYEHRFADLGDLNTGNTLFFDLTFIIGSHPSEPYWVNR